MTLVLIGWCVFVVAWAFSAANSASHRCAHVIVGATSQTCSASAGIAFLLVLLVGFFGFAFLSIIWFMSKPKRG